MVRLKICDSHLKCKVTNKCLNIHELLEMVESNKRWFSPFPCCPMSRQCPWKRTLIKKKMSLLSVVSKNIKKVIHDQTMDYLTENSILFRYQYDWLTGWLTGWLAGWLAGWLSADDDWRWHGIYLALSIATALVIHYLNS